MVQVRWRMESPAAREGEGAPRPMAKRRARPLCGEGGHRSCFGSPISKSGSAAPALALASRGERPLALINDQ
jgi:hypothetical protein